VSRNQHSVHTIKDISDLSTPIARWFIGIIADTPTADHIFPQSREVLSFIITYSFRFDLSKRKKGKRKIKILF
jgi:hypothetical protein